MKTIFITGAARGIGLATAKRFAAQGWFVGLYDINSDEVRLLLDSGEFHLACGKYCDVTQRSSIKEALNHFGSHTDGRLDVLVNNAGVISSGAFEEIDSKDHDLIVDVNVKGVTTVAQEAFPFLKQTPGSTLVNLCSVSCVHGLPLLAVYSASKFYVNGLTEALHIEWAQYDIRVTSVKPPIVNTVMGHAIDQRLTQRMSVDLEPEHIAEAVQVAVEGKRVSYLLGPSAKLWGRVNKILPEFGRRRLARYLSNY